MKTLLIIITAILITSCGGVDSLEKLETPISVFGISDNGDVVLAGNDGKIATFNRIEDFAKLINDEFAEGEIVFPKFRKKTNSSNVTITITKINAYFFGVTNNSVVIASNKKHILIGNDGVYKFIDRRTALGRTLIDKYSKGDTIKIK